VGYADVAYPGLEVEVEVNTQAGDFIAGDDEPQRLVKPFTGNPDAHNCSLRAFEQIRYFGGGEAVGGSLVHADDDVAGPQADLVGRGAGEGSMDNGAAVTRSHLHPHTVVVPALILPQQSEGAGVQEVGMGIERAQHAGDGAAVDGTVGVHWIGIVLLDNGKNLGEVSYGVFDVVPTGGCRFNPRPVDAAQDS